jgi:phage terminase large subunit
MQLDINIDKSIFNEYYLPHLDNMSRTQIFYGGSSSGKSVFLAQRCVYDILQGGRNYLVARAVATSIRGSVYNEITGVISQWGLEKYFIEHLSTMTITCVNGYQIIFKGLDDVEKIKSIRPKKGVLTDIWIEEATEVRNFADVRQLYIRQRGGNNKYPKRLTISFNPILKTHWIFQEFFAQVGWTDDQTQHKDDQLSILKSWYIHNRFLTDGDIDYLLNQKDEYTKQVYTFGNWGVLGNVIFTNWRVEDLSSLQGSFDNHKIGLDFGFSNDPAALICTHYDRKRKRIYIYDEVYKLGLTNDLLADEIRPLVGNEYVICDSAEPKSIAELVNHGIMTVGAKKGKDSIKHGIQWLKQQEIIIDKKCVNAQNEFQQYHYKEDKWGNVLPVPVDKFNHLIDALRYAYEDESLYMPAFL